jgi:hypothetical protein
LTDNQSATPAQERLKCSSQQHDIVARNNNQAIARSKLPTDLRAQPPKMPFALSFAGPATNPDREDCSEHPPASRALMKNGLRDISKIRVNI